MLVPVHDTPGRLRFVLPAMRGDRRRAAGVRARVRAIAGVVSVSANPLTGSLIAHYDGAPSTRQAIAVVAAEFGPSLAPAPHANARVVAVLADVLAEAIAERLVAYVLRAAVAAI